MLEGSVDLVTVENALGWLSDRNSTEKWDVAAFLDGRMIGEGKAELSRPDLAKVGYGDGMCGYNIVFYHKLAETDVAWVTVSPKGSTLAIPRSTKDSYLDVVKFLTWKYPQVGRSRTIHGGLWTDRTDSIHLLASRVHAGTCDPALFQDLRFLIADGVVEITGFDDGAPPRAALTALAASATDSAGIKDAVLALAPFHINAKLASLAKTVFDDVPVAYRPALLGAAEQPWGQASALEPFSSPAEVLVGYFLGEGQGARLDYILDSHELPEFAPRGLSRWTSEGAPSLPIVAAGSQRPVRSLELRKGAVLLVGPGLIHRLTITAGASVVRALLSPKRVTPLRFLSGDTTWIDLDLGTGVRGRI